MKKISLILLSAALFSACKTKDDPAFWYNSPEPVFSAQGNMNSAPLHIEAGNQYIMQSSYSHNGKFYQFKGLFKPSYCSTCYKTLLFTFNDSAQTIGGSPSFIDQTIYAGRNVPYGRGGATVAQSLGKVFVSWVDENGTGYTSERLQQPSAASFLIESVSPYQKNSNGEKTRKVSVSFSCRVFSATDTIALQNMKAVFTVAFP